MEEEKITQILELDEETIRNHSSEELPLQRKSKRPKVALIIFKVSFRKMRKLLNK